MSSPQALLATECDTEQPQQELCCVSSSSRSFQRNVCELRSTVRLASAAVLAISTMRALRHVEGIILATTGPWLSSQSRRCQR